EREAQLVDGDLDVLDLVEAEAEPAGESGGGETGHAQQLRRGRHGQPDLVTAPVGHGRNLTRADLSAAPAGAGMVPRSWPRRSCTSTSRRGRRSSVSPGR